MSDLISIPGIVPMTAAFLLLLALREIAAYRRILRFKYLLTPLVIISILMLVLLALVKVRVTPGLLWVLAALVFSLTGDTLLMIEESNHFTHGLIFFLCAHCAYLMAFSRGYGFMKWNIPLAASLAVIAFLFMRKIRKGLGGYALPVMIYMTALMLMVFFACASFNHGLSERAVLLTAGVLLFALSDGALAVNRFMVEIPHSTVITWILYAPAQYLIALSCFFPG